MNSPFGGEIALALTETVLGKEHPDTLGSMNDLALVSKQARQIRGSRRDTLISTGVRGNSAGQGVSIYAAERLLSYLFAISKERV